MPGCHASAQRLARTIARMPARTAAGRFDHASTTAARSRSAGAGVVTFVGNSGESLPFQGETGSATGLQIRIVGSTPIGASASEAPAMCRQQRPSQEFFVFRDRHDFGMTYCKDKIHDNVEVRFDVNAAR